MLKSLHREKSWIFENKQIVDEKDLIKRSIIIVEKDDGLCGEFFDKCVLYVEVFMEDLKFFGDSLLAYDVFILKKQWWNIFNRNKLFISYRNYLSYIQFISSKSLNLPNAIESLKVWYDKTYKGNMSKLVNEVNKRNFV